MADSSTDTSVESPNASAAQLKRLSKEVQKRRTFGIIAHPDAGKTTLTEKILLYAGCVDEAGAVRGKKSQRSARSDWMKMEQERGVSVTATCLSFDYHGYRINLLDTPGHQDFSEDTYRTLNAVDAAVMVIDAVKGIETQTIKLFKICVERKIPILTFINKMDRPGSDPLGVLTAVEEVLGIDAVTLNWPIGVGPTFRGIVNRETNEVLKFTPVQSGAVEVPVERTDLADTSGKVFPEDVMEEVREEVELLAGAGAPFDVEKFLCGEQTPVFYGSALTNFGVEQFLEKFVELAPPPSDRISSQGTVSPTDAAFSGLVFKVQANLDPRHRDRVAFVRVCSGQFQRDMDVTNSRTQEKISISRSHSLFAQERERVEEAFAGDVIGVVNPGKLRLGDTLSVGKKIEYVARWIYAPECFVRIRCLDTSKRKQFNRGLEQLIEEGAVQMLQDERSSSNEPVLAAVGELQFDVVQFRLETEYKAPTQIDRLGYSLGRWIHNDPFDPEQFKLPMGSRVMTDQTGTRMLLFENEWSYNYCRDQNPELQMESFRPEG